MTRAFETAFLSELRACVEEMAAPEPAVATTLVKAAGNPVSRTIGHEAGRQLARAHKIEGAIEASRTPYAKELLRGLHGRTKLEALQLARTGGHVARGGGIKTASTFGQVLQAVAGELAFRR